MNNKIIADVMVVDDHPMLRRGVVQLLQMEPGLNPVAECGSCTEALILAPDVQPDLILLDLNMPKQDGVETIRQLRAKGIDARIIIFTVSNDHADVFRALRAGADGYLLKDMEPEKLVAAIKDCVSGKQTFSPELMEVISKALRDRERVSDSTIDELTDREKQVLRLIAEGQSNKMIAWELNIAEGTVKVHVKRLLSKLGMRSRVEAAVWVVENNFVF